VGLGKIEKIERKLNFAPKRRKWKRAK